MQYDFENTSQEHVVSLHLTNGSWVLFNLADKDKQIALVGNGAHASRSGHLVGIYQKEQIKSQVIKVSNSKIEKSGGGVMPAHIVVVDSNGNNLTIPVRNKVTGHGEWKDVFLWANSPNILDLQPLYDMADFPPGRKFDPNWRPRPKG